MDAATYPTQATGPSDQPSQENLEHELLGVEDGQFYADLVKQGISFMSRSVTLGREIAKAIAGPHVTGEKFTLSINEEASDLQGMVSILRRVYQTYMSVLSPEDMEIEVDASREEAKIEATRQKYRAEQLVRETQFFDADREAVSQALLTGYNVRMTLPAFDLFSLISHEDVEEGTPMTFPVNVLDGDYSCDPLARTTQEERFRAVRIRISKRLALRAGLLSPEQIRYASGCGENPTDGQHEDLLTFWVVAVYERVRIRWGILYKPGEDAWLMPLTDWEGHPNGPIEAKAITPFRHQNRQVSPLQQLAQVHAAWDNLMSSNTARAIMEKTILAGQGVPQQKIEEITSSQHLGFIHMAAGQMPVPITYGGLTNGQQAILPILNDQVNNESANIQQSSGNKGISDTAREAMILQNNANRLLADLVAMCEKARSRCLQRVMFYDYYGYQSINGYTVGVPIQTMEGSKILTSTITPQDREADYFDMTFKVKTSPARNIDPAVKLDLLMQLGQALPMMVAGIAQIGGNPDPLLRDLAALSGLPGIGEMFPTQSAQVIMQAKMQEAAMAQQEGRGGGAQERQQRRPAAQEQQTTEMGAMGQLGPAPMQQGVPNAAA